MYVAPKRVARELGKRLLAKARDRLLTSELFANFISSLPLSGKRVADVGTGSGILALAAAKAGAAEVVAIDINVNAVAAAAENARTYCPDGIYVAESSNWRVQKLLLRPQARTSTASR